MASKLAIENLFNAMIEYSTQGGILPSVSELSDMSHAVKSFITAYSEVREQTVQAGMTQSLARAFEAADAALAAVQGRANSGVGEGFEYP